MGMAKNRNIHFVYLPPYQHGGTAYTPCGAEVHPAPPGAGYYGFAISFDRTSRRRDEVTCRNCRKALARNRYAPAA